VLETIYVEDAVASHPRTQSILSRFPKAVTIPVARYGEVFNRNHQSFRLQKRRPSLILAEKLGKRVLPAPAGYGIGSAHNFYFSHVLNCLYDCRYCFLQGMYRSAHYVLFVNYEDFQNAIASTASAHPNEDLYFFSGYDGDSLALDSITDFVASFVPFFADYPRAYLELRTKSAAIRPLLSHQPGDNIVVAFSFTPTAFAQALEHNVPPLDARITAMQQLAERGYRLGLRFDPLLYSKNYQEHYRELFEVIFSRLDARTLHSVSFGPFRMPRDYFQRMRKLYPEEKLFAGLDEESRMVSYPAELETAMREFCEEELSRFVPASILFPCRS
jgi:spore photoproduct lyase